MGCDVTSVAISLHASLLNLDELLSVLSHYVAFEIDFDSLLSSNGLSYFICVDQLYSNFNFSSVMETARAL